MPLHCTYFNFKIYFLTYATVRIHLNIVTLSNFVAQNNGTRDYNTNVISQRIYFYMSIYFYYIDKKLTDNIDSNSKAITSSWELEKTVGIQQLRQRW